MMRMLVDWGPLAVTVDAISWQDYLGGIIQYHCSSGRANHAVLITGFDRTGTCPSTELQPSGFLLLFVASCRPHPELDVLLQDVWFSVTSVLEVQPDPRGETLSCPWSFCSSCPCKVKNMAVMWLYTKRGSIQSIQR